MLLAEALAFAAYWHLSPVCGKERSGSAGQRAEVG